MKLYVPMLFLFWGMMSCQSGEKQSSGEHVNGNQPIRKETLLEKGDTLGAIAELQNHLQQTPADQQAALELAWLLAYKKDSSVFSITRWLQKSQDDGIATKALYIESHYYGNIGAWDTSIAILNKVIEKNFQFIDAYIQKGIILLQQKKAKEALNTFMLGLKIEPSNADLYYWISETHKVLGHTAEAEDWQKKYEALQ